MSVKEQTEKLEKEVVVEENSTELAVVEEEAKKTKVVNTVKKGLKVAGIALLGGVAGFLLGRNSANNKEEYYEPELIEGEVIDSDVE